MEKVTGVEAEAPLRAATVWFMAASVGAIVANMYYAQPLLEVWAREFHLTVPQAGLLATLTQAGTALGMLLFVPLGDTHEKRGLIGWLVAGACVALLVTAAAPNVWVLGTASLAVGMTSATVHVFLPFAATLAPEAQRGRVVGSVLSGMLFGILLARTFSGLISAHWGWRPVYGIAAGMMAVLWCLVRRLLPRSEPTVDLSYPGLLRSIAALVRSHAGLREAALLGALFFFAFSAFWTTLVFLLATPPYHFGSQTAGLFGLAGAAGAAGVPLVGRWSDRVGTRATIGLSLGVVLAAYLVLGVAGQAMAGLIVGCILLDFGVQSGHVANLSRIYGLVPEGKSRVNTFYMVCYFIGGALGSEASAYAWRMAGWRGVCGLGLASMALGLAAFARKGKEQARR